MKQLLFLLIMMTGISANASRLTEIEDYYTNKASDYIKARYPRHAFAVYVKVDAEDKPEVRKPAQMDADRNVNLPYFTAVNAGDIEFWDRKDVSLGTLISYLKSVYVKVDIDGQFSDEEKLEFRKELFANLKLSEVYDRMEVNHRQWKNPDFFTNYKSILMWAGAALLATAVVLFLISFVGIRSLVKGLSQPLSEISKSAENFAASSTWKGDLQAQSAMTLSGANWQDGQLSSDQVKWARAEIKKLSPFIGQPNGEVIQKIEELGAENPFAMGAVFAELEPTDLHSLVKWARGDWWRVAITQTSALTKTSLDYVHALARLQIRRNLTGSAVLQEAADARFEQVLARLSTKQFGALLENFKFDKAEKILRQLPQTTMIEVGKYLYPGEWAELLSTKAVKLDTSLRSQIEAKALSLCPLKTDSEINSYFVEADLVRFLDQASTKDEREVYRTMDPNSWIKKERVPFYEVFEAPEALLQQLTTNVPLDLWGLALTSCDRNECDKVYQYFNAKQKFLLRESKARFQAKAPAQKGVAECKKRIVSAYVQLKIQSESPKLADVGNEAAA